MEPKYRVKDSVYLVTGASRGAFMDTNRGFVYSVNGEACKVCSYKLKDDLYWNTLASMGIADDAEFTCQQELLMSMDNDQLKFVWFEIATNECNQRCIHCYTNSMHQNSSGNLLKKGLSRTSTQPQS